MKLLILAVLSLYLPCAAFFGGVWRYESMHLRSGFQHQLPRRQTDPSSSAAGWTHRPPLVVLAAAAKKRDGDADSGESCEAASSGRISVFYPSSLSRYPEPKKARGRPKAQSATPAPAAQAAPAAPAARAPTTGSSGPKKTMLSRFKKATTAGGDADADADAAAPKRATRLTADSDGRKRGTDVVPLPSASGLDDDESFDIKELLGDDFLAEGIETLLPNLDEDLAKLEANLGELGDGFDFDFMVGEDDDVDGLSAGVGAGLAMSETDLDETLRSIEAGKFDIDDFIQAEVEEDGLGLGLDAVDIDGPGGLGGRDGGGRGGRGLGGRIGAGGRSKAAGDTRVGLKGRSPVDEDDDVGLDEEDLLGDDEDDLALALRGLGEQEDDLMIDVVGLDEEVEDEEEEDEEDEDGVMKKVKRRAGARGVAPAAAAVAATALPPVADALMPPPPPPARVGLDAILATAGDADVPVAVDGIFLERNELEAGVEPPPLEEFKRLMESLGPESMFSDDYAEYTAELAAQAVPVVEEREEVLTKEQQAWLPLVYEGGKQVRHEMDAQSAAALNWWVTNHDGPATWRVQVISVVTNSSANTTALDMVERVYSHIRAGLTPEESDRVNFQTICYTHATGERVDELDDMVQMWLEGYNTYHLVDGAAMKEAWGAIMPHIMLSEKNLDAILDQVRTMCMRGKRAPPHHPLTCIPLHVPRQPLASAVGVGRGHLRRCLAHAAPAPVAVPRWRARNDNWLQYAVFRQRIFRRVRSVALIHTRPGLSLLK